MSPATDRPTLFILLGAAGDLTRRLVVPALFELYHAGGLPAHFRLLGLDRADLDVGCWRGGCARDALVSADPARRPRRNGSHLSRTFPIIVWI